MVIEIRGVGFVNKGAELMLHAILQQINKYYPDAKIAIAPSSNISSYKQRAQLGLYQLVTYEKIGLDLGDLLLSCISKKRREMYGLIRSNEVDCVLDASGFAHGDQWGVKNTKKLFDLSIKWKKNKTKLVLLPQAFGPFSDDKIKFYMKKLAENCDLIFAREEISFNYLNNLIEDKTKIFNMPDFTNLVEPKTAHNFDFENNDFCIIPNYKMVSKNWIERDDSKYLFLISESIKYLRIKGKKPFILVHEGKKDYDLANEISKKVGGINIFKEEDPLIVKGIINKSSGVIGSRFHSLVSALSQATPALGTSWSHKYQMLFKDYEFEDGIIDLDASIEEIHSKIDLIIEENSKEKLTEKLEKRSKELKALSLKMWEQTFSIIKS